MKSNQIQILIKDFYYFRVDLKVMELAKYEDGVCIKDTLTILGSSEGVATPVCGNMTGFESNISEYFEHHI